ncbi:M24 family metallopeptidase [Thermococcus sp. 101 C5]|jgi:Xaa-Pro dipeptidase|uniref:Xaa-Pro dipeptidase PepQ n=1 Tax=Thermococcus TaxID=2263 RepID=UPI00128BA6FF|nr:MULTISPECIES: Xaa-Pro dipeptidase PepQ [Thermococcus]MCA6214821.1 aminopeptidase P family protein [Thermococcus bergensis]MDK2983968.1 Xaa-Pro dipeptidase [Thermococcaceae archaeon]MPW38862.1 M24 family metallopeptidase [Thermococcus sp. 101 C5]
MERIRAIKKYLEENGVEAALITSAPNLFYFTNAAPLVGGYLVVTPDEETLLVPELEYEQAKEEARVNVEKFKKMDELYEYLKRFKSLAVEGTMSISFQNTLKEKAEVKEFKLLDDVIKELRMIKSEEEIKVIEDACRLADIGVMTAIEEISEGKREREIAAKVEYAMKMEGAEKPAFDTIIASGYRSALPHGVASDKRIERGDLVVMDLGALYRHYNSDITRTIVVGTPNEKQKEIYEIVLEAQKKAVEEAKPGMTAKELDSVARKIIEEYGYGDKFIHSLGHGIGLQVHEWPRVSQLDETVLKEGMVVTIEPGIYIPKFGGVRIEDTIVITKNGAKRLTKTDRELI